MKATLLLVICFFFWAVTAQRSPDKYWNRNTKLIPWRIEPVISNISYIDLDNDGDPDILKATINDSIPIMWIDDDDDMKYGDTEGDTDNDCLLIDRNRDGIFGGPGDFSIKWADENGDGKADIQLIVNNGGSDAINYFDWEADYIYILDSDKDNIMHFVDWNKIMMLAWEHSGQCNFFEDYHGNSQFMKMHASSFRIGDLRYNWENPFIFYDTDGDKLTEMAIRCVDTPKFRDKDSTKNGFDKWDKNIEVLFSKKIDWISIAWDLDNDNAPGNEFDFDMSLNFKGTGFDYSDQVHNFKHLKGLEAANKFLYDSRWRNISQLYYPDRSSAWDLIFKRGKWQECRFVFDEDDDCNRWERVEFYDPLDIFKIGKNNGGLDNNPQSDASGDRGEFDMDCSGNGQLYIGAFDGRIHLYGAEWGAWRIDQTAYSFQGFGGLYGRWDKGRIQQEPESFATVKYTDTDNNGFIDLIQYDLDGDKVFEEQVSLLELGIDDKRPLFKTSEKNYKDFNALFKKVADDMWNNSSLALKVAQKYHINTDWYAFYKHPLSMWQKYDYGYWLAFYIYRDLKYWAKTKGNSSLVTQIDKAYYSGNWGLIL